MQSIPESRRALTVLPAAAFALLLLGAGPSLATPEQEVLDQLKALPGFEGVGKLPVTSVKGGKEGGVYTIDLDPAAPLHLYAFKAAGGWTAIAVSTKPGGISLAPISPALADILGDAKTAKVILAAGKGEETVDIAAFPKALKDELAEFADASHKILLKGGANLLAKIALGKGGALGRIKGVLGAGEEPVQLTGSVGPDVAALILKEGKLSPEPAPAAGPMALTLALPAITPSPFNKIKDNSQFNLIYKSTRLSISGQGADVKLAGAQELALTIHKHSFQVNTQLAFTKEQGKDHYQVSCSGDSDAAWDNVFGHEGFKITKVSARGKMDLAGTDVAPQGPSAPADARVDGRKAAMGGAPAAAPAAGKAAAKLLCTVGAMIQFPGQPAALPAWFDVDADESGVKEISVTLDGGDNTGLELGALPGIKSIPGAEQFRLDKVSAGIDVPGSQLFLHGDIHWKQHNLSGTAAVLLRGGTFCLFLKGKGFTLKKLIPELPDKADMLSLDSALVTICSGELNDASKKQVKAGEATGISASSLPSRIQSMLADVTYGNTKRTLEIGKGLSVLMPLAAENSPLAPALHALALDRMKIPVVVTGTVTKTGFNLIADLGTFDLPHVLPEATKKLITFDSVMPTFALGLKMAGGQPELQMGIDTKLNMKFGKDPVAFGAHAFVDLSATNQSLNFSGRLIGQWNNPFGLDKVVFGADPQIPFVMGFGVDAKSVVEIALSGSASFGGKKYGMSGVLDLETASVIPAPTKLGLLLRADELMYPLTQFEIMEILLKSAASGPLASAIPDQHVRDEIKALITKVPDLGAFIKATHIPLDLVKFTNVELYLATPGVSHPDLPAISGMGVKLKGTMNILHKDVAATESYLTMKDGLVLNAKLGDFNLGGVLALKGALLDLHVPLPQGMKADPPRFIIAGETKVLLYDGKIDVELSGAGAKFAVENDWGHFGKAKFVAQSVGASLKETKDFIIDLDVSADFKKGIQKDIAEKLEKFLVDTASAEEKKLSAVTAKRDELKAHLDKARADAARELAPALDAIARAQHRVDEVQNNINHLNDDINNKRNERNGTKNPVKKGKLQTEIAALEVRKGGEEGAKRGADAAFHAASAGVKAGGVEGRPEVIKLRLEYDKEAAEALGLEGAVASNKAMKGLVEAIAKAGAAAMPLTVEKFALHQASFVQAAQGKPQILEIGLEIAAGGKKVKVDDKVEINLLNPTKLDLSHLPHAIKEALARK